MRKGKPVSMLGSLWKTVEIDGNTKFIGTGCTQC